MFETPMDPATRALRDLARSVERTARALRKASEMRNADFGLTGVQRAVMEAIREGPRTVPDIARERGVTRQHVQAGVDALAASGLVLRSRNPANAKSWLIGMSRKGQAVYQTLQSREALALRTLSDRLSAAELEAADAALRTILTRLGEA